MHELMDFLINELNELEGFVYAIKHDGIDGDWFLKDIDFPVEDDLPIHVSWTEHLREALHFKDQETVKTFAMEYVVPRPCTIIRTTKTELSYV